MKKITLLLTLIISSSLMFSQVVLTEDFEAGLTIPAGWTNNDIAANGEVWTIEDSGEAVLLTAGNTNVYTSGECVGNYATFNSDGYGNNGNPEEAALESPIFDCSALTSVALSYNHYFAGNYGGSGFVEVNDGSGWTTVATYSGDGYVGGAINLDVTTELAGAASAQVRFRWTGDWSVAWYVDNISVFQCTVNAPNAATVVAPVNAAVDVEINYGTTNNIGPFEWTAATTGDPADSFNISIGETVTGDDIGSISGFNSGGSINYSWTPNTTYYWFIESVNCAGATPSSVWSFTTSACTETAAPAAATTPTPTDTQAGVEVSANGNSVTFSWASADPNADYTLNLGTSNPPDQAFNNFESGDPITGMALNTTYYWSVDAVNCFGTTTGPIWSFTTNATLSVEENKLALFTAYPNPTSDVLNIKTSKDIESVNVLNLLGKSVATFKGNEIYNNSINLSGLSNGLYLVKISTGDTSQTIRVTKK
ncbi:MAG: T9SS type A sorting domain-containing protein [Winogradskyella sp.]